ncbi:ParA family protein [Variovorax sp. H27-G14]|uniref:ParA family protein n=1 Tax=Variovorax sp. H27-G14 TaxID=3111914 RepID=UPI0038FC3DAF
MAKIFCIANQKGGVGKTTTTVNLAAGLAKAGQRVLMIDLDPQGNATMGSGIDKRQLELTVYDVLLESASVAEARVKTDKLVEGGCGYDVLGANRELAGAEVEMVAIDRREKRLRTALAAVGAEYDFVLIDCPPSLSLLTLNGLCAAHGVIVPMQCEYFALEGLTDLVNTIKQVHANLNKNLQIIGLLRVMFDPRITLQQQVSEQLKSHFGDKVFDTVIPRNVRLAEAPSYGLPGVVFDPAARGSQAFIAFAQELIEKMPPASAFASGAVAPPIAPVERVAPDLAIPDDVLAPVSSPASRTSDNNA